MVPMSLEPEGWGAYLRRVSLARTASADETRAWQRSCLVREIRELEERLRLAYEDLALLERLLGP
jgi:hypothetical protein